MRVIVHVKPNSKEFRVERISETERIVYVRSPPVKNKANEELVKELKKLLKRPVRIVSGFASRTKVIEVGRVFARFYFEVFSETPGYASIGVLLFTYPLQDAATDLLRCRGDSCEYRFYVNDESFGEVAFEVRTANVSVGLKEPMIGGKPDSRILYTELEELSKEFPENRLEYLKASLSVARSIRYSEQSTRLGVHEALRLGIGDCEEITDVLMALLAIRGFIVRRIVGLVPGGLHARLEYKAKDGTRVPIDPTRGQVGFLDWRHVPIFRGNRWPLKLPKRARIKTLKAELIVDDETVPV